MLGIACAIALTLSKFLSVPGQGMQPPTPAEPQTSNSIQVGTYKESGADLTRFLRDYLAVLEASDSRKSGQFQTSLVIPNHDEWFHKIFGNTEGPRLESKYLELSIGLQDKSFPVLLTEYAKSGCRDFFVTLLKKPVKQNDILARGATEAMQVEIPLYEVGCKYSNGAPVTDGQGYFVYVDGGFRYIPAATWRALSKLPNPMRFVVGTGYITQPQLISRVLPIYPAEAGTKGVTGVVRLHVVVGTDGRVQQVSVVSGDPLLTPTASDAVKQWRYQPYLLQGNPVEVEFNIDVNVAPRK